MKNAQIVAQCPEEVFANVPELEISQLAPCQGPIAIREYQYTDDLRVGRFRGNTTLQVDGQSRRDWFTFLVTRDTCSRLLVNRVSPPVGKRVVAMLNGGDFSAVSGCEWEAFNVSIGHDLLARCKAFSDFEEQLFRSTCVFEVSPVLHQILIEQLNLAYKTSEDGQSLEANVADITMTLLASVCRCQAIGTTNRARIVASSLQYIRSNIAKPIEVEELAELSHCSLRTLQYAFRKTLGLSPNQYLRNYRLNVVRRAILNDPDRNGDIAAIAREYGFNHAGHFSRMYRELFGQKPSEGCNCGLHSPYRMATSFV